MLTQKLHRGICLKTCTKTSCAPMRLPRRISTKMAITQHGQRLRYIYHQEIFSIRRLKWRLNYAISPPLWLLDRNRTLTLKELLNYSCTPSLNAFTPLHLRLFLWRGYCRIWLSVQAFRHLVLRVMLKLRLSHHLPSLFTARKAIPFDLVPLNCRMVKATNMMM